MINRAIGMIIITGLMLLCGCAKNISEEGAIQSATATAVASPLDRSEKKPVKSKNQEVGNLVDATGKIKWSLPDGFISYEGQKGLFVYKTYPEDIACISYLIADYDESSEVDQQLLVDGLVDDFYYSYGEKVDVIVQNYEELVIGDYDAVKIEVTYQLFGTDYELLQLLVFDMANQEDHIFSYLQEKDEGWMEVFRKSAATVHIE